MSKKRDLATTIAELVDLETRHAARSNEPPRSTLGAPATARGIAAAEKRHGSLASYRDFLALHDGWKHFPWGMWLYSTAELTKTYNRGYIEDVEDDDDRELPAELASAVTIGASENDASLILLLGNGRVVEWLYQETSRYANIAAFLASRAETFRDWLADEAKHERRLAREWDPKQRAKDDAALAAEIRGMLAKAPRTTPGKLPRVAAKRPKATRATELVAKRRREVVAEVMLSVRLYLGHCPSKAEVVAAYAAWRRRFASKHVVEWMYPDEYFTRRAVNASDTGFLEQLRIVDGHYGIRAQVDTKRDGRTARYVFNLRGVPPDGRTKRAAFCEVIVPASESADALAELTAELLAILPVRSGRGGYSAYVWDESAEPDPDGDVHGWCKRFWGIDVGGSDGWLAGALTRLQGAGWLTVLGPAFAGELARAKRLAFPKPITVATTDRGIIVRCGPAPQLIDVARGEQATVAHVEHAIAPLAIHVYEKHGWVSFGGQVFTTETTELGPFADYGGTRTWMHRFLDPAAFAAPSPVDRTRELLAKLAHNLDDEDRAELDEGGLAHADSLRLLFNAANEDASDTGIAALRHITTCDCREQGMAASQILYLYLQNKRWKPALAYMDEALALAPRDKGILHNAACIFARAGHPERALDCIAEAKRLRYKNMKKLRADDDLVSLHGTRRWKALFR